MEGRQRPVRRELVADATMQPLAAAKNTSRKNAQESQKVETSLTTESMAPSICLFVSFAPFCGY